MLYVSSHSGTDSSDEFWADIQWMWKQKTEYNRCPLHLLSKYQHITWHPASSQTVLAEKLKEMSRR